MYGYLERVFIWWTFILSVSAKFFKNKIPKFKGNFSVLEKFSNINVKPDFRFLFFIIKLQTMLFQLMPTKLNIWFICEKKSESDKFKNMCSMLKISDSSAQIFKGNMIKHRIKHYI